LLTEGKTNPGQRFNIAGLRLSKFSKAYALIGVSPSEIVVGDVIVLYDSHSNALQYGGEKLLYVTGVDSGSELSVDGSTDVSLTVIPYAPVKAVSTVCLPPYQNVTDPTRNLLTLEMPLSVEGSLVRVHDVSLLPPTETELLPTISEFVIVRSYAPGLLSQEDLNLQILSLSIASQTHENDVDPFGCPYLATAVVSGDDYLFKMLRSLSSLGVLYLRLRGYTEIPGIPSLP